jgi:purine nucleosidase
MVGGNQVRLRHAAAAAVALSGVLLAAFAVTLAMPVETWRSGERFEAELPSIPPEAMPSPAERIWIDADAGCGAGPRVDADDCLAILYLARRRGLEIAGLSTVFGNAPLEVTDRKARELARILALEGAAELPVHRGADEALGTGAPAPSAAQRAIEEALAAGPLTILALGPLTNVATALAGRPDFRGNVERIVAVMGRRPGHIFHPLEGSGHGMLFGHGPVFRDFNLVQDPETTGLILAMDIPLVLVPYEAARELEVEARHLDQMRSVGVAGRWVAERARSWLEYWESGIGRSGFFPFDLVAAAFVVEPHRFRCAEVAVELGRDDAVHFPFSRMPALLVEARHDAGAPAGPPAHLYCHAMGERRHRLLHELARAPTR